MSTATAVCVCKCVLNMYFSLPVSRHNMLSGFDFVIFFSFVSDDIFVINDIIEVEMIALNSVISLKMISAPALHPYCKVAWQF